MPWSTIPRHSVTDDVFDQILSDVMGGTLQPGAQLPSERRLAELLGVSRPVVREALQRMAQAGLVDVRHGGATRVRDFSRFAGLDLLPRLLFRAGDLDLTVVRSILEARLAVGPQVAALAAERATPELADALGATVELLADSHDPVAMQQYSLAFWDQLVDGADSVVFRLMFNSLRATYEPALEALAHVMEPEASEVADYRRVVAAISAGDDATARDAATDLLTPTTTALLNTLIELEKTR